MLNGLAGVFAFYNGGFEFKSGEVYPGDLNYGRMRAFCAMFGVFLVPMAYFTAIQLKMSKSASIVCALMVLLGSFN